MTTRTRRTERRTDALSRDRIVATAIELLDAAGEAGLTFRALSERLATGPGAIYWHVANKDELLDAATDAVVADALAAEDSGGRGTGSNSGDGNSGGTAAPDADPRERIRAVALGLFDAIDEHPWVAARLSATSWQESTPRIFERVGRQVRALGVPQREWFTVTSVLVQYILGAAAQNAANGVRGRTLPRTDRSSFLDAVATTWEGLDPDEYSFTRTVGDQMRDHDDREQFLAGIDLALTGVTTLHLRGT